MSEKNKIALIVKKGIDWKSCQSISSNLVKSYESLDAYEIKHFEVPMYNEFPADLVATSKKICEFSPDKIVFVDHGEAPSMLLTHYLLNTSNKETEFIFHIYGDFTFFLNSWAKTFGLLKSKKVKLVCASEAQSQIVAGIMERDTDRVKTIPFSVESNDYFFSQELRDNFRTKHNLSKNDKVVVYTGRISLQKNVVYLVECFRDFCKKFGDENLHLLIAGPCDDIGMPYLNKNLLVNFYRSKFLESIEQLDNVKYLGVLEKKELNELYSGADIYCSLSTHNDEDFGMAPAEALMTGCQGVLTNWGGYQSFIENSKNVYPVDVEIKNDSIDIVITKFYKTLMKAIGVNHNEDKRKEVAREVAERFSLNKSIEYIRDLVEREGDELEGVSDKLLRYAEKSKNGNLFHKPVFSDEYFDIYKDKYDK